MSLADVWFALFVLIIAGYLILDGFDIGVGVMHLVVARTDTERRMVLNSIGPVWDGNEVWIILGAGVLFAAFPLVYASLFSGLYLGFMSILLVLIIRTGAIEFRSKRPGQLWRGTWDKVFSLSSILLAWLLGLAFGNILAGVDLNANGDIHATFIDLLTPYAILIGVTAVAMFALHGLLFIDMKIDGPMQDRVRSHARRAMAVVFVLVTASVIATAFVEPGLTDRFRSDIWPLIFPAGALVAFAAGWRALKTGREFQAFAASSGMIALLLISGAVAMYPNMIISNVNEKYNLTANNAAAASNTLEVILIVAIIGIPLVLLYTAGVYYFFRGKTELGPDSY